MSYSGINKNVFSKLPTQEVELSSEKVELGSIDILKDDIARMKKGIDQLKSLRKQMRSEYLKAVDKVSTNASNFNAKAKELGLKADSVKEYNDVFDMQRMLDDEFYKANNL